MKLRELGRTGNKVSEVGFGAWAIGGSWGAVQDSDSIAALDAALDAGVTFIDTADVYGDGRSESLIGRVLKERRDRVFVATKMGRRAKPHVADAYNRENFTAYVERSLKNLRVEALDLVQLHSPPPDVLYRPEVFGILDDLKAAGKIRHYGVSIVRVEEAIKAVEYPGVETVQMIFNIFRRRPVDLVFRLARERGVGIIVRVPLASGLLSGRMTRETAFPKDDHRNYNRQGEFFDVGETFAGLPFEVGLEAVEEVRSLLPGGMTMAQFALKWILMHGAVSTVIPGAKTAQQAASNAAASDLPDIDAKTMDRLGELYDRRLRHLVHQRW